MPDAIACGCIMKKFFPYHLLILPWLLFLFSCSAPKPTTVSQPTEPVTTIKQPSSSEAVYIRAKKLKKYRSFERKFVQKLHNQYRQWKGTPYRLGGLSKNGVDCSGFVYLTYRSLTDITLPRTTRQQVKLGRPVDPRHLRAGDLVFFKTGWSTRHVGIYIENGSFLHASTKKGVIISKLSEHYWQDAFWIAKRL